MIRLTVDQLNALRDSIQAGGQVHCAVLPLAATYAHSLVIAWAKGRAEGEEFYLSIWRDTKSLIAARQEEEEGVKPPYDFINDPQSAEYTHTYPVDGNTIVQSPVNSLRLGKDGSVIGINRGGTYTDSSHPEFGVSYGSD